MLNKKLIFALILLMVTIGAISTVSASDDISQDNISTDCEDVDVISLDEDDSCLTSEITYSGNFEELNDMINATEAQG